MDFLLQLYFKLTFGIPYYLLLVWCWLKRYGLFIIFAILLGFLTAGAFATGWLFSEALLH